jgi:hypothetical protein
LNEINIERLNEIERQTDRQADKQIDRHTYPESYQTHASRHLA